MHNICSINHVLRNVDRIMPLIREKRILMLSIHFLNLYHKDLLTVHILKASEALSLLVDTDDFKTYRDVYIADVHDAKSLLIFKTSCLDKILDFQSKKLIRPLLDSIDRAKRKYRA